MFSKKNRFRLSSYILLKSKFFEVAVLVIIMLSTLKLTTDTYLINESDDSPFVVMSNYLDIAFTTFFTIEMIIKIIALGFWGQ